MLGHMRQSALIVIFHDRSHLDDQSQFDFLLGFFVLPDVICQAIVELSLPYFWVHGQLVCTGLLRR